MTRILIIEDDINLGVSIEKLLKGEGHKVDLVETLEQAQDLDKEKYEIIILDWMLPDGQGIDFLRNLRANNNLVPVIMLTARVELVDKVLGLETGANDYLTKPFEPRELVARIRVQLRSRAHITSTTSKSTNEIISGDLTIKKDSRKVIFQDRQTELTKMEFDLLLLLAESPGRVFSREEILNQVWGYDNFPTTRTVDTHILQLRQKLSEDCIETMRGIGYRFKVN